MEGKNQSSSFTDLFSTKESSASSGIFASMFPPPSTVASKNPPSSEVTGSWQKQSSRNQVWNPKQGASARSGEGACHLSSSLYYGGQDIYSQSSGNQTPRSYSTFKKDGGEDDPNGNNSQSASRGNWWQGSLYY